MLRILDEQREALAAVAEASAIAWLTRSLADAFPELAAEIGPAAFGEGVARGVGAARAHGFESERDVRVYITLMIMLGSGLDDDPLLPWVKAALSAGDGARLTAFRLAQRARGLLDAALGRDDEHRRAMLFRLAREPFERMCPEPASGVSDIDYICGRLDYLDPAQCRAVGAEPLRVAVAAARDRARENGLPSVRGAALVSGMMLMLGSGFERDPFLPWCGHLMSRVAALPFEEREPALYEALRVRATRRAR